MASASPAPRSTGVTRLLLSFFVITTIGLLYILVSLDYQVPSISSASAAFQPLRVHLDIGDPAVIAPPPGGPNITRAALPSYSFIVFIITAPGNLRERQILRETSWPGHDWGEEVNWRYVFVVGRVESAEKMAALEQEMEERGDMVMADETDTYENLVLKVLWILRHALDNYKFQFLVKTDDDTFINIALLNQHLNQVISDGKEALYFGGVKVTTSKVFRTGRYGVDRSLWGPDIYAPYCSGSGYVLSYDTVERLLSVYESGVQPIFYVEDAYMGALAFHSGDITISSIYRFYWHQKYGCTDKKAILMHYVKREQLGEFMSKLLEGKAYCNK